MVTISFLGFDNSLLINNAFLLPVLLIRSRWIEDKEKRAVSEPEKNPENMRRSRIMDIFSSKEDSS
jgi:hypothetical protein